MMLCVSGGKTKLDFLLYIFLLNSAAEYRSSFSHFVSLSIKKLFLYVFIELEVHLLEKKKKKRLLQCALAMHPSDDKEVPRILVKKSCLWTVEVFFVFKKCI